jgi:hypothetical protein
MRENFHLSGTEIQEILEEVFGPGAVSTETREEIVHACEIMKNVATRYAAVCASLQARCNAAEEGQVKLFLENRMLMKAVDSLSLKETKE